MNDGNESDIYERRVQMLRKGDDALAGAVVASATRGSYAATVLHLHYTCRAMTLLLNREVFWQEFEMGRMEFSCNDVGLFLTQLLRIAKVCEYLHSYSCQKTSPLRRSVIATQWEGAASPPLNTRE